MNSSRTTASPLLALYPAWQWLVWFPLAVLITLVCAVFAILVALLISPRLANLYIAAPWGRMLTWLVPVRVEIEGIELADRKQSYVVVANHQSQFDITVVYGFIGLDLRWVAKSEVGKIPFVAAGCRAIGHIFIERGNHEQSRKAINQAVSRLQSGTGLMFFPEGTRSRTGRIQRFKKGAFRVAIDRQLPILPVTVIGTREILPPGSARIRPGKVRLIVHPPISTSGMTLDDLGELRRRAHAVVESGFDHEKKR